MMIQINRLQGTARVINYAGLVRGATQREVKLEITGSQNDELIKYLDDILSGLKYQDGNYDLIKLQDKEYQDKLQVQIDYWNKIKKEIKDTQSAVKSVTGTYPKTFRPPYRAISKDMCEIIKSNNMNIVLWSYVDARDWSSPGVSSIIKTIENGVQNGCIILLHDYNKIRNPKSQTIEALDKIIPDLLEKGYKFVTISELIEHLEKNTNNENNIK